jgi:hypothetical protein
MFSGKNKIRMYFHFFGGFIGNFILLWPLRLRLLRLLRLQLLWLLLLLQRQQLLLLKLLLLLQAAVQAAATVVQAAAVAVVAVKFITALNCFAFNFLALSGSNCPFLCPFLLHKCYGVKKDTKKDNLNRPG